MKNLTPKTLTLAALALIALGGIAYYTTMQKTHAEDIAPASGETVTTTPVAEETSATAAIHVPADPLGERSMGNPDAPVKIEEFASLSCGHCAAFHKGILPELKKKYIDTGKVFFTFTDFPLNAPALDGTLISRCMPPERYFPFLSMLFENQESWAFSPDYRVSLEQNAKLAGMSDESFKQCLDNTKLKEGIVARMQEKQTKHGINSTPSFVINGTTVLTGALPIDAFDQAIADALKAKDQAQEQVKENK